jgi:hypothetical protein
MEYVRERLPGQGWKLAMENRLYIARKEEGNMAVGM